MNPDELLVVAKTVGGEARGEGRDGMKAVAHVIFNRVAQPRRFGVGWAGVCLRPRQFSCWNEDDPNRAKLEAATISRTPWLRQAVIAVMEAWDEKDDPTHGSTHYHTKAISANWAQGHTPAYVLGNHLFYNTVR